MIGIDCLLEVKKIHPFATRIQLTADADDANQIVKAFM